MNHGHSQLSWTIAVFRRFIQNVVKVAAPLTELTKKGSGVHNWDENCDRVL